jgi:hypothetical protein
MAIHTFPSRRRKRYRLALAVAVGSVIILTLVTYFKVSTGEEGPTAAPMTAAGVSRSSSTSPITKAMMGQTFVSASAARDLRTLVNSSDVIATGTIVAAEVVQRPEYIPNPYVGTPVVGKEQPEKIPVSFQHRTKYTLHVNSLLKADAATPAKAAELTLTDIGAIEDSVAYVYGDLPVYEVGAQYLVFMLRHPRDPSRLVTALGRFSQFAVVDGRLTPGDGIFPFPAEELTGAALEIQGKTAPEIAALISGIVSATPNEQ